MGLLNVSDLNLNVSVSQNGNRIDIEDQDTKVGFHISGMPPTAENLSSMITNYLINLESMKKNFVNTVPKEEKLE